MVSWSYLLHKSTNDKNKIGSKKHKQEKNILALVLLSLHCPLL